MTGDQLADELAHGPRADICANCKKPEVVQGSATPLCADCRRQFIKFPIPLWIKLFAGAVCVAVLFSLYTFPEHLSLAVHMKRGEQAIKQNNFLTAKKEFGLVLKKAPRNTDVKAFLMLSAFYNEDYNTFMQFSDSLDGVTVDNEYLQSRLNDIINIVPHYFQSRELHDVMAGYDVDPPARPDTFLMQFLQQHPADVYGLYTYASQLYRAEEYAACDSVLQKLFAADLTYYPALRLAVNVKREMGGLDSASMYCDRLLQINKESIYGYAYKARVLLMQKNDSAGLRFAQKSMEMDNKLPYNIATLALAYHFNNDTARRNALINDWKEKNDSSVVEYYQYVKDVIDQKEIFRN